MVNQNQDAYLANIAVQAKRTTDGHGQPSDGRSGGGGGGNLGPGLPGRLSHTALGLESVTGQRVATDKISGGYGGLARDVSLSGNLLRPFGAGGAGGAGLHDAGGAGGASLTLLFQDFMVVNGTVEADGMTGDSSTLYSYGVGGGAGGSIFIYSVNGTLSGDTDTGILSSRGGHGALGGGSGSGGRIAIDVCYDHYNGNFDARGGVGLLPLRQAQLLHNMASSVVTASAGGPALNMTQQDHIAEDRVHAKDYFHKPYYSIATGAAGSGSRLMRNKGVDDETPVLLAATSGTLARYTGWHSDADSVPDRCVMATHRRARSIKIEVSESWSTQDLFNSKNRLQDAGYDNDDNDGNRIGSKTLAAISTQLMDAYRNRNQYFADSNLYSKYYEMDGYDNSTSRLVGEYLLPKLIPDRIPAMDTVIHLPLDEDDPNFALSTGMISLLLTMMICCSVSIMMMLSILTYSLLPALSIHILLTFHPFSFSFLHYTSYYYESPFHHHRCCCGCWFWTRHHR